MNRPILLGLSRALIASSSALLLAACSAGEPHRISDADRARLPEGARVVTSDSGEESVEYTQTQQDRDFISRREPLAADSATLYVNGLGCPQCASNIDVQLLRLPGVDKAYVDLGLGQVRLSMSGAKRPSPAQINSKVEDAGFTLVRITEGE